MITPSGYEVMVVERLLVKWDFTINYQEAPMYLPMHSQELESYRARVL